MQGPAQTASLAQGLFAIPVAKVSEVGQAGSGPSGVTLADWLTMAGTVVAVVGLFVTVGVAAWQWRVQSAALTQRDHEARRQREIDHLHAQQHEHRSLWTGQLDECQDLLRRGEDIVWKVLDQGPFTDAELDQFGVDQFRMDAQQLAERRFAGPPELLTRLAEEAGRLRTGLPDQQQWSGTARTRTKKRTPAEYLIIKASQRKAIEQDRAARQLAGTIKETWTRLRREWDGDDSATTV